MYNVFAEFDNAHIILYKLPNECIKSLKRYLLNYKIIFRINASLTSYVVVAFKDKNEIVMSILC